MKQTSSIKYRSNASLAIFILSILISILLSATVSADDSSSDIASANTTNLKYTPTITTMLSCGNNGENPVFVNDYVTDQVTFSWNSPDDLVPTGIIELWQMSPGADPKWDLIEIKNLKDITPVVREGTTIKEYTFTSDPSKLTVLGDYYFKAVYNPEGDFNFESCNSGYYAEKAVVYTLLKITKTVNNSTFSGPPVTFEIRQGAAAVDGQFGNVLEQKTADMNNNGQIDFDKKLYPGLYQLCEYVPLGYESSYITGFYGVDWFKPGYASNNGSPMDNTLIAINFIVNKDGSITFPNQTVQPNTRLIINNQSGYIPLTIGFWKNHCSASGSNGRQDPILDQMLYKATQAGYMVKIGDLFLPGSSDKDNAGESAVMACKLLNKSRINDGKKMASDPAFNLAAQLMAYQLNNINSARPNNVAFTAAAAAQTILDNLNFDGITLDKSGISNNRLMQINANMNYLSMVLDSYNNDTLKFIELNMPYPGVIGP